jgi:hypothetical protein
MSRGKNTFSDTSGKFFSSGRSSGCGASQRLRVGRRLADLVKIPAVQCGESYQDVNVLHAPELPGDRRTVAALGLSEVLGNVGRYLLMA